MSDTPLDDLERELVHAAGRRIRPRQRRPSRRTTLLAAAIAVLVAVPAWATGLLRDVFPPSHESLPGVGTAYVVATGTTDRGEPWRFELTHGARFRDGAKGPPCVVLAVGTGTGFVECTGDGPHGGGARGGGPALGGGIGTLANVSRHDHRRLLVASVPLTVKTVAVRFSSGRELLVRPLAVDQGKARRSGVPYPGGFLAVAYGAGERLTGLVLLDVRGRPVPTARIAPRFTPSPAAPLARSPVF
jgi:hypothetical protein